jgi:hypothetical protein
MTPELPLTNLPHDPALEAEVCITHVPPRSAAGAKSGKGIKRGPRPKDHAERVERWIAKCVVDENGCWIWPGSKSNGGYAHVRVLQPDGSRPGRGLHRVVYEHRVGPVPEGLDLDHLCRVRACCNPAHLEPVTPRENILRGVGVSALNAIKTHCIHGHEFTPENTARDKSGRRQCRECSRAAIRRNYWRHKEKRMSHLLMVKRADAPEHTPEAEGLLVDTDTPGVVRLVLDDGIEIVADRAELVEALSALREVA